MSDQSKPVDLNTASLDELSTIPGIGPEIASRIQSGRPYQSIEELKNVPGIGANVLERVRMYFYLPGADNGQTTGKETEQAQANEPLPDSQIYEADVIALPATNQVELLESDEPKEIEEETMAQLEEEGEPSSEIEEPELLLADEEAVAEERPETSGEVEEPEILLADEETAAQEEPSEATKTQKEPEPTVVIPESQPSVKEQPRYASRSDAFWISFGSSFLAFVLAIALTLGALALINNGLRYVSPAQLSSVSRQVDGLSSQASILQQDLDGLRTRVDNLEGLSGRVSTVEQTTEQLRGDLDAASTQVEQLNQNVSGLQTDVTELKSVSDRFQSFLDGLRELLNNEQQ